MKEMTPVIMKDINVTVVCPIYNEGKYIDEFLRSVLLQDYPPDKLDILLVDGMSNDNTREISNCYSAKYKNIHLVNNPYKTVPYALNKGIKMASGDVVIRMDAHCTYPVGYISRLVEELYQLNADNVGGLWNTLPAKNTIECLSIAIASSHPFGVGSSTHKIGTDHIMKVDTVPFGCYKKELFDRIGFFDCDLIRNQDDEFNARIIKNGGSIYIIPDVVIDYTARDCMRKMRKMYYQYGLFKPLVNKKLGSPATLRQFFPALFLIGLVVGGIVSTVNHIIALLYMLVLILYFGIGLYVGVCKACSYRRVGLILYIPYTFLNIHISYGWGYIKGMFNLFRHKDFSVNTNR
jgi:glycosyltransferase involved in cell wall biosynthesis